MDEGLLSYSVRKKLGLGSDSSMLPFSIDYSGWILVTGLIDRERVESYELVVCVCYNVKYIPCSWYFTLYFLSLGHGCGYCVPHVGRISDC